MLKIWGRTTSSNVKKVLWCCAELGLEYERVDLGGPFGGNQDPEYLKLNPNKVRPYSIRLIKRDVKNPGGADAKTVRADGISALALCAGTSSPDVVAALIAKGANVNAADPEGQTRPGRRYVWRLECRVYWNSPAG